MARAAHSYRAEKPDVFINREHGPPECDHGVRGRSAPMPTNARRAASDFRCRRAPLRRVYFVRKTSSRLFVVRPRCGAANWFRKDDETSRRLRTVKQMPGRRPVGRQRYVLLGIPHPGAGRAGRAQPRRRFVRLVRELVRERAARVERRQRGKLSRYRQQGAPRPPARLGNSRTKLGKGEGELVLDWNLCD